MATAPPVSITTSRHFLSWLQESGIGLAFTTYQTNRLFLIGTKEDGTLSAFERQFDRPMGLCVTGSRLYMSTRWQIWELDDALPAGESYNGYDRMYVPRRSHTTGELDVHDVAVDRSGEIIFVNTAFSCLAKLSDRYSFKPIWKPSFIDKLAPEDRCHLNGLAMADGAPAYVTSVSRSDVLTGWRDRRHEGGTLIDVEDNEIVLDSLSMPHSPRVHRDKLWVLNSGTGDFGYVDRARGAFEPVAFCPGFLRGLAFHDDYAVVGLSKNRREKAFAGLALDDRLAAKDAEPRCGLWVIDLRTGNVAHWMQIEGVVIELYDVQILPDTKRPMALGFKSDDIARMVTIDTEPKPIFASLPASEKSKRASPVPQPGAPRPPGPAATPSALSPAAEGEYRAGNELAKQERFAEAVAHYEAALRQHSTHTNTLVNLGTAHYQLGDLSAATGCYRRAVESDPRSVRARCNLGLALRAAGGLEAAAVQYRAAAELEPGNPDVLNALGSTLSESGSLPEAKACFERAVQVAPSDVRSHLYLAGILLTEDDRDEALRLYRRAAELEPRSFEACEGIARILQAQDRVDEAKGAYATALLIRSDPITTLRSELLAPPVFQGNDEIDRYREHAEEIIDETAARGVPISSERLQALGAEAPFGWIYHGRDNLALKRKYAALFAPSFTSTPVDRRPSPQGPWNIGFVVTPRHELVFLRCMGGVLDGLDSRRFRVTVLCDKAGEATLRRHLRRADMRFVQIPPRFDHTASAIRRAEIDVLYFWEVGTDSTNYFLPFLRLAPVQCTGWGWPDTSGAPALDFHLTSEALASPEVDSRFTEQVVRLPHLPAYATRPPLPEHPHGAAHFGLPEDRHLYVCVQNILKAHPDMDAGIHGILEADPHGVVVFVGNRYPVATEILHQRWRETLPDSAERVLVLPHLGSDHYAHLVARADVLLDTPHFGASNSAYDAFAAGTPLVTMRGDLPRGRYAAALNAAAGLERYIASSAADFAIKACRLGTNPIERAQASEAMRAAGDRIFEQAESIRQLEAWLESACRSGTW